MAMYADAGIHLAATDYEPHESQPNHCHNTTSITLVLAGAVEESTRFGTHTGRVCSVLVKPGEVYHADRYGPAPVRTFQVILNPRRLPVAMPTLEYGWHEAGAPARAMIDLLTMARSDTGNDRHAVETAVSDLLATVSAENGPDTSTAPSWITDLTARIDCHPETRVSVQALAEAHRLHPVSVARSFRRHVGCSITNYVRRRRVVRACRLMQSGDRNLAEIALLAGFSDQAHLTRTFRTELGLPPARFRRIAA